MRNFNEREKEILKLLSGISPDNLEIFAFFLQKEHFTRECNRGLLVLPSISNVILYIRKETFDDEELRKKEIFYFLELVSLIDYLKNERLITVFPNQSVAANQEFSIKEDFDDYRVGATRNIRLLNQQGLYIDTQNPQDILDPQGNVIYSSIKFDNYIYNLVKDNFMGLLFVSEDLKDFVNNNFTSKEERKFRKSQTAVWTSILIAFIFGFLGLAIPKCSSDKPILVKSPQLDSITRKIDSVLQHKEFDEKIDTMININLRLENEIKSSNSSINKIKNKIEEQIQATTNYKRNAGRSE